LSAGSAAAGQVTNFLAPEFGWEAVFWSAGVVTGLLAIVLQFTLPESARWMVAKGKPAAEVLPLLSRFDPSGVRGLFAGIAALAMPHLLVTPFFEQRGRETRLALAGGE